MLLIATALLLCRLFFEDVIVAHLRSEPMRAPILIGKTNGQHRAAIGPEDVRHFLVPPDLRDLIVSKDTDLESLVHAPCSLPLSSFLMVVLKSELLCRW